MKAKVVYYGVQAALIAPLLIYSAIVLFEVDIPKPHIEVFQWICLVCALMLGICQVVKWRQERRR